MKRARHGLRIFKKAAVYTTSVLEYLVRELMNSAGVLGLRGPRKRVEPKHLMYAIKLDEDFSKLLKGIIIPGSGAFPTVLDEENPKEDF